PRAAAFRPCLSFAAQDQALPVVDPGRNRHADAGPLLLDAGAVALHARIADDAPAPAAAVTRSDGAERPQEGVLRRSDLAAAAAGAAGLGRAVRAGPGAAAAGAG